jgi:hypothetical protein
MLVSPQIHFIQEYLGVGMGFENGSRMDALMGTSAEAGKMPKLATPKTLNRPRLAWNEKLRYLRWLWTYRVVEELQQRRFGEISFLEFVPQYMAAQGNALKGYATVLSSKVPYATSLGRCLLSRQEPQP